MNKNRIQKNNVFFFIFIDDLVRFYIAAVNQCSDLVTEIKIVLTRSCFFNAGSIYFFSEFRETAFKSFFLIRSYYNQIHYWFLEEKIFKVKYNQVPVRKIDI